MKSIKPFKGPDSFQPGESHNFFGRDREARELRSLVLGNRLSLLHAPSGAGKTSLVNAALVPILEYEHEWIAAVARPGTDPELEIRMAVLLRLFPSPASECETIKRLVDVSRETKDAASGRAVTPSDTLETVRREFSRLLGGHASRDAETATAATLDEPSSHVSAAVTSETLRPVEIQINSLRGSRVTNGFSVFQRFLESPRGPRLLMRHLASLMHWARLHEIEIQWPGALRRSFDSGQSDAFAVALTQLTLDELDQIFRQPAMSDVWSRYINLHFEGDVPLPEFFQRLYFDWFDMEVLGQRSGVGVAPPTGVALILDQFEEMFTRPEMRQRSDTYFKQLQQLYEARYDDGGVSGELHMPLRILISMRDEHVAQLDRIRAFASDISRSSFHLSFFTRNRAELVIVNPAKRFGFSIEQAVVDRILDELSRDDDYIEPILVQIVLDYLWQRHGNTIEGQIWRGEQAVMTMDQLNETGSVDRILQDYLLDTIDRDAITGQERSTLEHFEILALLDALVMGGNRRAIIERDVLINEAGHSSEIRARMLDLLISRGIVREERRISSAQPFAEISHEGLIPAVNHAVLSRLRRNTELQYLQLALTRLARAQIGEERRAYQPALPLTELSVITDQADQLQLGPEATEIALRSAIMGGAPLETCLLWARRLDEAQVVLDPSNKIAGHHDELLSHRFDRLELRALFDAGWPGLKNQQSALHARKKIIESLLQECEAEDAIIIRKFVEEVINGQR